MEGKSFRKTMALLLTLAMAVSLFAGLGINAFAVAAQMVSVVVKDSTDEERIIATWTYDSTETTYRDDATSAELAIVKDFTEEENLTGSVNGTLYDFTEHGALVYTGANKKPDCRALAVTTKGILLEDLIDYAETASGLSLRGDTKLLFADGEYKTNEYTYSEYWG